MTFAPKAGGHSIAEVIFGLTFSEPFSPSRIDELATATGEWRTFLPRVSRSSGFEFKIDVQAGAATPLVEAAPGAIFDRMNPDGTIEWRINVMQNAIYVNCLNYSTWAEVRPRALDLIKTVSLIVAEEKAIAGFVLQYIDLWDWTGDREAYDLRALLQPEKVIPGIFEKGPNWHLHYGWFRPSPAMGGGRILERFHLDAVDDIATKPTVKLDGFLSFEPAVRPSLDQQFWVARDIVGLFDTLHDLNKQILGDLITEEMANRIGLNGKRPE